MLKKILYGRKWLADEAWIRETGFPHEVEAFYATRKPNWKLAVQGVGYGFVCALMFASVAVILYAVCAETDYNWIPLR